jgi:ATP-dependent Lhr-like helicase
MPLSGFHPVVERWFAGRFAGPTEPQRRAWPVIQGGGDVLIAAPTGSGKTFAAFLSAIDALVRRGLDGELKDETQVLYVSPLKALSNDVQKNLSEPLAEIRAALAAQGLPDVAIRTLVRTGDTPQAERQAMVKQPPHILVTTPESLYLILTSERAREMLRTVRTVIVDEIHAVARDKRGSHLALSLARLDALTGKRAQRIGLSATQRPIEEIARFLVGTAAPLPEIVDAGHARTLDLTIEIPASPLEAVMAAEVWEEVNARIAELIAEHRTTLVFVNTRRLCERLTMHLSERLGADHVTSHHGSLSREKRLEAEERLKRGELKALVATASLELGIDIGAVDLVIQVGSTRSIATLLQRVGRSGHRLGAVPKGRLFPLSRDDLIECAALVRATREGRLDRLIIPGKPLDILAQQIVAAAACEEWHEDALFDLVRSAYPYRDLTRREFDDVVQMLAEGFTTRRGRRGAHLHYDGVNRRIRGRRGARLSAITSGGAIPDLGDYRVVLEPTETFVGTLNEDFAIESAPGDIFQLGNTSYQVVKVESGQVRVADAKGQPPTLPFWVGEAPGRTIELSEEVSRLRQDVADRLSDPAAAIGWLADAIGLAEAGGGGRQIVEYLAATKQILGVIPTQACLVLERFFDEAGGMQLVLHAPFGSRINRAWGLALRKRFCRSFNFELQAAATEDAIVLSLGPQHSFPLDDVFQYLKPATAEHLLVQAMLDAPVFGTRWRWNATRALAVLRFRGGRKVPTPLQRMDAEDLVAAVFPDQLACPENLVGDREIPDHPLVNQTIADCLLEAMDFPGLKRVLEGMEAGEFTLVARDTPEPSPLCHEVLNARPYAFLDDAPLEERRTQAVITRRGLDVKTADELGTLDPAAIERVRDEAWPDAADADELHDALLVMGGIPIADCGLRIAEWKGWFEELARALRATVMDGRLWVAAERVPMLEAVFPGAACEPAVAVPERERTRTWTREDAIRELVRGRLEVIGPTTAAEIAAALGLPVGDVDFALGALEHEGFALRGRFSTGVRETEWCERRLLARIHRYTLDRLRKEIEPVAAADFLRFLFRWQRVSEGARAEGPEGLAAVLDLLDGFEVAAGAWESDVLPARLGEYDPLWLDGLCLSGEIAWGRLTALRIADFGLRNRKAGPIRTTPIALFRRERGAVWRAATPEVDPAELPLSHTGRALLGALDERGASFFGDLVNATGLLRTEVEKGLGELVAWGLVSSDSFAGLRALLVPSDRRRPIGGYRRRGRIAPFGVETAGRWARVRHRSLLPEEQIAEAIAWQLLRRYGVVFRRLVQREGLLAPWRDILRVYRRLEARGEVRGGRFVGGFSGEQYALPEAIGLLRTTRREHGAGELVAVSGADPLNLVGILTPGDTVAAVATNRILYRDGVPVAVREGEGRGEKFLVDVTPDERERLRGALVRRRAAPLVRAYLGKSRAG